MGPGPPADAEVMARPDMLDGQTQTPRTVLCHKSAETSSDDVERCGASAGVRGGGGSPTVPQKRTPPRISPRLQSTQGMGRGKNPPPPPKARPKHVRAHRGSG